MSRTKSRAVFGRHKNSSSGTRVFFATDIHGSEVCFRKFINAGEFYDVSLLVLGGDVVGKMLVPILEKSADSYSAAYGEKVFDDINRAELEELQKSIRRSGHYYVVGDQDEIAQLASDEEYRDLVFRRVVCESIEQWVELAEERLVGSGRRCLVAPGNDDFFDIDNALRASDLIEFAEDECISVNGYDVITTGYSNETPWQTDRELSESELKAKIERMAAKARPEAELIAVLHAPPFGTGIDEAPALDDELTPSVGVSGMETAPVGSTAVREFIEERQPLLSLHGHVHEGKGVAKLGRTLCINPGSEYTEGTLSGVVLELGEHNVLSHQLVTG
jgi:Icc-related predicted phosphoesterase